MDFYELDENLKARKKEQAKRLLRGEHVLLMLTRLMLDAAQYVNTAWDAISDATIKNAFNKAELLNLAGGTDEEVDMMADLLRSFKALNIPVDERHIFH